MEEDILTTCGQGAAARLQARCSTKNPSSLTRQRRRRARKLSLSMATASSHRGGREAVAGNRARMRRSGGQGTRPCGAAICRAPSTSIDGQLGSEHSSSAQEQGGKDCRHKSSGKLLAVESTSLIVGVRAYTHANRACRTTGMNIPRERQCLIASCMSPRTPVLATCEPVHTSEHLITAIGGIRSRRFRAMISKMRKPLARLQPSSHLSMRLKT